MIEVQRTTGATPEAVWKVLADGWTYPLWVVGASRMRAVDPDFPAKDSRLHHSAGAWPVMLSDTTHVLECEDGHRLLLQARGWPVGEATIEIELVPDGDGTRVVLREDVSKGPTKVVPKPLRALGIVPRNRETLRRLAYLAERRTSP